MNKKVLLITVIVLVAVLGVAAVLYPKLSAGMQTQPLATVQAETAESTEPITEEPTEAATETETAEETEPAHENREVDAPDFIVQDWDGNEVHLHDYLGKPIVLNFWAHWCGPCQMEMPEFNAVWEELGGEVTFLMTHVGSEVDEGKAKVTENGYTFPVLFDNESAAANYYGIGAYPTSIFIDAQGHIKAYYIGVMDRDLLQRGIDMIYTAQE